jgi:hypothetical protein
MEPIPPIRPPAMPPTEDSRGKATAGLVLGIIGMIAWFIPCFGLPVTITGLVFSLKGLKSTGHGMAVAGLVMSIIGLVLTVINMAIGAYLGATGQNPLVNKLLHH